LFDWAAERDLLLVDVKPPPDTDNIEFIPQFRSIYYPSIPVVTDSSDDKGAAGFARVGFTADKFFTCLIGGDCG